MDKEKKKGKKGKKKKGAKAGEEAEQEGETDKLEVNYRRDEKVIRFMTVKLDKYAAEYAIKRKNKYAKKSEEA